ncbi:porin family protein [Paludibacterium purpuratum]|uniref:Opacity protein-like surface antigen n=1 Tax=Paludibacterium purpuratum TaxID=1144873 RepID=A0A4R7BC48_9NEIS|nr:porin family protein [Paludibacterium purpuratum]TDR82620.1 opacity protein-like surface antigen [Paludibacterium purpuratum]
MQMKQIRLTMLAVALVAGSAFAAEPFVGPSIGLSVSSLHTDVDFGGMLRRNPTSASSAAYDLNVGYGLALAPKVVLNAAASYGLNKPSAGTAGNRLVQVSGEFKDRWSVSLAPGYLISSKWMAYGKVAYQHASMESNTHTFFLQDSQNLKFHGWGYGAGVAYAPIDLLETSLEVQRTEFSTQQTLIGTARPMTTAVTLGAAWRF